MPFRYNNNSLGLDDVPNCFTLTEIGNACISRNIIFL